MTRITQESVQFLKDAFTTGMADQKVNVFVAHSTSRLGFGALNVNNHIQLQALHAQIFFYFRLRCFHPPHNLPSSPQSVNDFMAEEMGFTPPRIIISTRAHTVVKLMGLVSVGFRGGIMQMRGGLMGLRCVCLLRGALWWDYASWIRLTRLPASEIKCHWCCVLTL